MPLIQFATQSYRLPQLPVSAQRAINCYAEREPEDAKQRVAVFGIHGLSSFTTCGVGPIRGMWMLAGVLYVVSGPTLYSVSSTGTATPVGSAVAGSGVVSMSDNGVAGGQLIIVGGGSGKGYIYSTTTGFFAITSVNFFPADVVMFFDSYFVLNKSGTNAWFLSNLLDGSTYQATNIAEADGLSGNVVSLVNQLNTILIFGETHMETWWDSGSPNFPMSRYIGNTVERGCIGPLSTVKEDNAVFFMGNDLIYYRLDGVKPTRVSTHATEADWSTYSVTSDLSAFSYTHNGHKFVVLNFPTASKTWVYDVSTNLWHERQSWDQFGNNLGRWRPSCHIRAYGMDLFGDAYNGTIGELDDTVSTEYGNTIQWQMAAPPIHHDRRRVFHSVLELDMETGVGLSSGQGQDPQVIMDYSDDGGRTWKVERWTSLGALGAYTQRVRWTRLGWARQRVYRVTITDPVRRTLIAAHGTYRPGSG